MSAETLRHAAALMRERAEAATPGPWQTDPDDGGEYVFDAPTGDFCFVPDNNCRTPVSNATHIASWHPAVALAVAAWLDEKAASYDASEETWTRGAADPRNGWEDRQLTVAQNLAHHFQHPLAVARTYLGKIESFRPEEGQR